MNTQLKQYPCIDLAKFLLAFVIVGIHTTVFCQFKWLDMGFDVFSRVAVPFFFTASGFFYFRKPITRSNCAKFTKRILILYLIYSAIFIVIRSLLNGQFDLEGLTITLERGIRHLWFLHALLLSTLLATVLMWCIKKAWIVYIIAALCLVIRWSTTTMWPLFADFEFLTPIHMLMQNRLCIGLWNALCFAFPMITIGHWIAQSESNHSKKYNIIATILSFLLLGSETYVSSAILHTDSRIIYLSFVPFVYFAMRLCQQIQWPQNTAATQFMRKTSTLIYCIHPAFILTLGAYVAPGLGQFAVVSVCALLFGILVYLGSRYRLGWWLKYLQ